MITPTNLLFYADRTLRAAASSYASEIYGTDNDMLCASEDELRQAAIDFAQVANSINAHQYTIHTAIDEETITRIIGSTEEENAK